MLLSEIKQSDLIGWTNAHPEKNWFEIYDFAAICCLFFVRKLFRANATSA